VARSSDGKADSGFAKICLVEMVAPQNCIWEEPVQILPDTSFHDLDLLIYEYFSVIPGKGCYRIR